VLEMFEVSGKVKEKGAGLTAPFDSPTIVGGQLRQTDSTKCEKIKR